MSNERQKATTDAYRNNWLEIFGNKDDVNGTSELDEKFFKNA